MQQTAVFISLILRELFCHPQYKSEKKNSLKVSFIEQKVLDNFNSACKSIYIEIKVIALPQVKI